MRKSISLLAMTAFASAILSESNELDNKHLHSDNERAKPFPKKPKKIIPKGMKEFHFSDGFSCFAINDKVAQKKYEKFRNKQSRV